MDARRTIPPGSREEAQIAESIIYGLLWQVLVNLGPLLRTQFSFKDARVAATGDPIVPFNGLTIVMASGEYEITVKQTKAAP